MVDDTGALKEAYYGSPSASFSGGSGGSDLLSGISSALSSINPVLGFASNILGGLFGSHAQSSANKANIEMQRETNHLQYQMFREANAFTERMWNLQNDYNTPANQAARLKEAGINPAFVFGNGSISEAGGVSSASAPSLTAPHQDPYNILPSVNTAVDAFMQSQYNNAQINMLRQNERNLSIQNDLDSMTLFKKIESLDVDNKTKQYMLDWYFGTDKARKDALRFNNANMQANTEKALADAMAVTLHSQVESALARSQLRLNERQYAVLEKTIKEITARIGYYGSLSESERKKQIGYVLDNGLAAIDFGNHYQLRTQLKQELEAEIQLTLNELDDYEPNWWHRTIQGYIPFVSPAVAPTTNRAVSHRPTRVRGFVP